MKKLLLLLISVNLFAAGCSSDDNNGDSNDVIEVVSADQSLLSGAEFQIEAKSISAITYASENNYHAIVSQTGLVKAQRVGTTNIVLSNADDTKRLRITVNPRSNLFPEPDMSFGATRDEMKSKHGTPDGETESAIGYNNYSPNAPVLMYMFDENDKLKASIVMVKTEYSGELGIFLGERYVKTASSEVDYTIAFVNGLTDSTITMGVGASLYDTENWMVMYFPFTTTRHDSIDHLTILESMNELAKLM